MTKIMLFSSLKTNLLALNQNAKLQSITQQRLSTGLKVNSAIDNPSAYYTASSLNNRAGDLSALLDNMGQSIQTIKTAEIALEKATAFLEQAKVIANKSLELAPTELSKDWFEAEAAKQGGVVVSSATELDQAIADNKALIVVYGKIEYTKNQGITLNANQKLVGTEYFTDINKNASYRPTDNKRISELNFESNAINQNAINLNANTLISDISVNYLNTSPDNGYQSAIYFNAGGTPKNATIKSVDINFEALTTGGIGKGAIYGYSGANINIKGDVNIQTKGHTTFGIWSRAESSITIDSRAIVNIKTKTNGYGISAYQNSSLIINGELNINAEARQAIYNGSLPLANGNTITIGSTAKVFLESSSSSIISNGSATPALPNIININQDAVFALKYGNNISYHRATSNISIKNESDANNYYQWDSFQKPPLSSQASSVEPWQLPDFNEIFNPTQKNDTLTCYNNQFNNILIQYDMIISDASYKGINLLDNQSMSIIFNESSSSKLELNAVKAKSDNIGVKKADWQKQSDVKEAISAIEGAINQLRGFSTYFGNNLEIVQNREEFTNNLINTLTEGADKLILADMNEESANMLSLQTAQQLAINALSLAAQNSQAILKLFR